MTQQKKGGLALALVIILGGLLVSLMVGACLKKHNIKIFSCEDCE